MLLRTLDLTASVEKDKEYPHYFTYLQNIHCQFDIINSTDMKESLTEREELAEWNVGLAALY